MSEIKLTKKNIKKFLGKILLRKFTQRYIDQDFPGKDDKFIPKEYHVFVSRIDEHHIYLYKLDEYLENNNEFCILLSFEDLHELKIVSDQKMKTFLKFIKMTNEHEAEIIKIKSGHIEELIEKYGFDSK